MSIKTQQDIQFDLNKLIQILLRRKLLIFGCILITIFGAFGYNHFYRPIYRAQTTIVFDQQNSSSSIINPFRNIINKSFIINQMEEIKSRSLAEEVMHSLPQGILNTFSLPKNLSPDFDKEIYITYLLQQKISVRAVPNSEVIKIAAEAYTPIAAKVIANTISEVYQQRNLEVKRKETTNVRKIIDNQLLTFKGQLDSSEIALKTLVASLFYN